MKTIEVVTDKGHMDTIAGIAEQYEAADYWLGLEGEDGRQSIRLLVSTENIQGVLDKLQGLLSSCENSHIIVQSTEVVLPKMAEPDKEEVAKRKKLAYREEIYNASLKETKLNGHYLTLVVLSTLVAAIGLIENNVAVIIGAMVIAPLLGPNLAFGLATALADRELMLRSVVSIVAGLSVAILLSFLLGLLWPATLASSELISRTSVGLDSIALALASGAAAVLSLTSGVSTVLVGVMVAVALLPPAATVGLMLASGYTDLAQGAALLLGVNIVSVNLAAKLVFLIKGVRPRTWLEQKKAKQSMWLYVAIWLLSLIIMIWLIVTGPAS